MGRASPGEAEPGSRVRDDGHAAAPLPRLAGRALYGRGDIRKRSRQRGDGADGVGLTGERCGSVAGHGQRRHDKSHDNSFY